MCVCQGASAALRPTSISGAALHPTVPHRDTRGDGCDTTTAPRGYRCICTYSREAWGWVRYYDRPERLSLYLHLSPRRERALPDPAQTRIPEMEEREQAGATSCDTAAQDVLRAGCLRAGCFGDLGAPWRINSPEQVRLVRQTSPLALSQRREMEMEGEAWERGEMRVGDRALPVGAGCCCCHLRRHTCVRGPAGPHRPCVRNHANHAKGGHGMQRGDTMRSMSCNGACGHPDDTEVTSSAPVRFSRRG